MFLAITSIVILVGLSYWFGYKTGAKVTVDLQDDLSIAKDDVARAKAYIRTLEHRLFGSSPASIRVSSQPAAVGVSTQGTGVQVIPAPGPQGI